MQNYAMPPSVVTMKRQTEEAVSKIVIASYVENDAPLYHRDHLILDAIALLESASSYFEKQDDAESRFYLLKTKSWLAFSTSIYGLEPKNKQTYSDAAIRIAGNLGLRRYKIQAKVIKYLGWRFVILTGPLP